MSTSVGILTVSDSCFSGDKNDESGTILSSLVKNKFPNSHLITQIVPDEKDIIVEILKNWCEKCNVILTTGGTGFAPRDVTPEATKIVIEREAPGIITAMITESLKHTPMAMLTRAVCGIKNKTIIVNFPGSSKGVRECFMVIQDVLQHAVDLLLDRKIISHNPSVECNKSKVKIDISQRARQSIYPLIELSEAFKLIEEQTKDIKLGVEKVPIEFALYRVLAEDVISLISIPSFDVSMKDGYAVIAADGKGKRRVINASTAGDAPIIKSLTTGEAIRISTGAPIPNGADAVVQVEDTELLKVSENDEEIEIVINTVPKVGLDIRKRGTDVEVGTKLMEKHERMLGANIGVLASVGQQSILVFRRPTIGVISSGNELVHHSCKKLKPGQIYDSNKLAIINLLKEHHFHADDCGIARDNPDQLKRLLVEALDNHDVIVSSGGVSMGEFDLVKQVLIQDFNATIHFGRINMKPGKPTTFSTLTYKNRRKLVFSLPGNPASACVTGLLFVVQTLNRLEQAKFWQFPSIDVWIKDIIKNKDPRPEMVRVIIDQHLNAVTTGNQISSRLNSFVDCNGLVFVEGDSTLKDCKAKAILFSNIITR